MSWNTQNGLGSFRILELGAKMFPRPYLCKRRPLTLSTEQLESRRLLTGYFVSSEEALPASSSVVEVGDIDNDGDIDIMMVDGSPQEAVVVLANGGQADLRRSKPASM